MILWFVAFVITMAILRWWKIDTKRARAAIGCLIFPTIVQAVGIPFNMATGLYDYTDITDYFDVVLAVSLLLWFAVAKSRKSMIGICIFFTLGIVFTPIVIFTMPTTNPQIVVGIIGSAVIVVVYIVGLINGIYCIRNWNTTVLSNEALHNVFE
jgi:hypothetical protein